jgi:phosphoglycerate dehydrogenase-like enzyme
VASERVFVSWPGYAADDPETGRRLLDAGYGLALHPKLGARSGAELKALLGDAVAAIVSTDPFTAEVIDGSRLKVIARVGVGYDSVDRAAADRAGVAIATTPGQNAETVADHALALILALVRKVPEQDRLVRAGRWERVGPFAPGELPGRTVGLIGCGAVGGAVARRLRGFGVRILVHDPAAPAPKGAEPAALDGLLASADVVSLHLPLLPSTRNLLDAGRLARMGPGALLVNTSRGGVVDEAALIEALRAGRLGGAALDVFADEPPDPAAFAGVPNLVLSPHLGGISRESIRRMTAMATDSVLRVLAGELPETIVNRDALRPGR